MTALRRVLPYTALAGACLICSGFVIADHSPAPQSIGVALIFLHPFLNNKLRETFRYYCRNKALWACVAFYLLTLLSIFYTQNMKGYGQDVVMKLPFMLLPFGLAAGGNFHGRNFKIVAFSLIIPVFIAGTASFTNYLIHFAEINEQISHSKPIPIVTGINHIYYGLLLAFSACMLLYLLWKGEIKKGPFRSILIIVAILMVVYLHTISARTGLVCFYAGMATALVGWVHKHGKIVWGIGAAAIMAVIIVAAILFIPSLRNRFENTKVDLDRYSAGENINYYSLSMRIAALDAAWQVFKRSPIVGVGPADLHQEMLQQYEKQNSPLLGENRKLPHNQFMQTASALGIIGFLVLLAIFLVPAFHIRQYHFLALIFLVVSFVAFQFESVLERQAGLTFFVLFYCILCRPIFLQDAYTDSE